MSGDSPFSRLLQSDKDMAAMMPEGARALLVAFGKRNLCDISPESAEFLKSNSLIERMSSLSGNEVWVVTPLGKRVRKAIERKSR
jgi:hypothetical protein